MDLSLSSLGLLVLSPLLGLIALGSLVCLGRPILWRQKRIGRNEKPFVLVKFRSMRLGTCDDAQRLNTWGNFLRKLSLDELPSLWNIVKGEMSLVGPRPLLPSYLPLYTPEQRIRHQVMPGLTGLAQVRGRNALQWPQKFRYDRFYVQHASFWLDMRILYETIPAFLRTHETHHPGVCTMPLFTRPQAPSKDFIYLAPPALSGKELDLIREVLESGYITMLGPMVDRFEDELKAYTGYPHVVAVSSGTAALHLALRACGVGPGDSVWTSSFTFIGGVVPIAYCGAQPVFFDVTQQDWTLDPQLLEHAWEKGNVPRPKAIIATDIYGCPCQYDAVLQFAEKHGIPLISDAAESLGSSYRGTRNTPPLSIFSFNGNKVITTSGGGAVACHDPVLAKKILHLSRQARVEGLSYFLHDEIGFNYRMSNVCAAIGVAQIAHLDERVRRKKEIFNHYMRELQSLNGISFMPHGAVLDTTYRNSSYWLSLILLSPELLESGCTPQALHEALWAKGIETRHAFQPMHKQPPFRSCPRVGGKVCEALFAQGVCLPSGVGLSEHNLAYITQTLREFLEGFTMESVA